MTRLAALPLLAVLVCLAACGGGDESASNNNGSEIAAPPATSSADEAVTRIARGLADGSPDVLWHALPGSYQKDVSELVHTAADEIDAELWNRTFSLFDKLGRVMSEKREFILAHPMIAGQLTDVAEAQAQWDAVVGLFDTVVKSDLADLDKVRRLDVGQFLAKTGGAFMRKLGAVSSMTSDDAWAEQMANLRETRAEVISGSGDDVIMRVEVPGEPPKEEAWTVSRASGSPRAWRTSGTPRWPRPARAIASLSGEDSAETTQMAMMQLAMAEGVLDTVLAANTPEEFNASLGSIFGLAMAAASQMAMEQEVIMPQDAAEEIAEAEMASLLSSVAPSSPPEPAPQRTRQAGDNPGDSFDPDRIVVQEAHRYVGQWMRVRGADGLDFTGELLAVDDGVLRFEKRFRSGDAWFDIPAGEIRSLHFDR